MNAPWIPEARRRRFTTDDVIRMVETGLLRADERVELIEGELALMSPKHNKHEWLKARLIRWLVPRLSDDLILTVESTLYLSARNFIEPDIMIYAADLLPESVRGPDTRLLIEVADSSLSFDLGVKAALCAEHDIAHYWVIDADTKVTHVHAQPSPEGYGAVVSVDPSAALVLPFATGLSLKIGDLK